MGSDAEDVKDKGRADKDDNGNRQREKKFDKKRYRLQKYSNKYKINQWEERRKKAVLREYYKELKKDQRNSAGVSSSDLGNASRSVDETSELKKRGYAFFKARQEYQRKQEEKRKWQEDAIRARAEREEALRNYREKKMRNFKVLSRRTRKGQPVMKGRIEMLLEKIQRMT